MDVRGREIAVIGAGASGVAAMRLLLSKGATVRVLDRDLGAASRLAELGLGERLVHVECGPHREGQLGEASVVIVSPGVPPSIAPLVEARERGLPVLGEVELGARMAKGTLLGITGSNGKSTTVSLAEAMLQASGLPARAGGNIGRPFCDLLLESDTEDSVHCLELSSFQCETLEEARLAVVALLNISPDHLDRYDDFAAYAEAKLRLLDQQGKTDAAVLPSHSEWAQGAAKRARGRVTWFGLGPLPGPGIEVAGTKLISTLPESKGPLPSFGVPWSRAPHDLLNAAAAGTVALLAGATPKAVAEGIEGFGGLAHRCSEVRTATGPVFINDSKATNVAAALVSIEGSPEGVVVILGGRHKGGDTAPLREALLARKASAVLIGEASEELARSLAGLPTVERAETMAEAVATAAQLAGSDGTVLLAPACASFDMFDSFEHRGRSFADAAHAAFGMPGERGCDA